MERPLRVVYEDAQLLVVDKPAGMLVHRGWGRSEITAISAAREATGRFVHNVHRLDRATSGLLLMCFEAETARALQAQWPEVDKRYLALVRGRVAEPQGRVDHPIPGRERGPRVAALTSWRRLAAAESARCSWLELRPHTGRLHQLRRHLKHLSHPIVGDVRYGDGRVNRDFRTRFDLHRLALHAWSLRLRHPHTGAPLRFDLAPADQLGEALAALEITASPPDAGDFLAADLRPAVAPPD